MSFGAEKHPPDQVRCGDSGSALHETKATSVFDKSITVLAATICCDVITVDDIVATIVRNPVERGDIWCMRNCEVRPSAGVNGINPGRRALANSLPSATGHAPFFQRHHCGTLILHNVFV